MTTQALHPLAGEYVRRLRRAARRLPPERRDELVAEIEAHLLEALDPRTPQAEARAVLDRLGAPEAIVDAEQPPAAAATVDARGGREVWAVFLLVFGGLFAGVGWLLGVFLLWTSRAWPVRDKVIGTLVVPGGLALPWYLLSGPGDSGTAAGTSSPTTWIVVSALLALASIATSMYLSGRARRAPART